MKRYDFIIIGAGVVGLAIARSLARRHYGSILVLEKESSLGKHASGRNSGVIHTGIYYQPDSQKAKVCTEGARLLKEYAAEHNIPLLKTGKVILATSPDSIPAIECLYERAQANGVRIEKIDERELATLEPLAKTFKVALFTPDTSVIDSMRVLEVLELELNSYHQTIKKSAEVMKIDSRKRIVYSKHEAWGYGHLINAAGLQADKIAHGVGVGREYTILPFKGIYRQLQPPLAAQIHACVYPAPDLNMPFLGTHLTKTVSGEVTAGPTALPALGRENYGILDGLGFGDTCKIFYYLLSMFQRNTNGLHKHLRQEFPKYFASGFLSATQSLVPSVKLSDFVDGKFKVGIRAQLIHKPTRKFVMDFLVERGVHSTHILNAVSPAFTSSLSFAESVVNQVSLLMPRNSAAVV